MADGQGSAGGESRQSPEARSEIWGYLGVGILMAVVGLVGGGMIGVLVAKIVGAFQGCVPDKETGAPCRWGEYWTWGARVGLFMLPTVTIWRMRRGRLAERKNTERG